MGKPTLVGNPGNIFVSPAQILLGSEDLGFASGVSIKTKELTTAVKTDQLGKIDVNDFHMGFQITVEMMLDELIARRLKDAYTYGDLVGTFPNQKITWGQSVGGDYFSLAQQLTIKPTVDDVNFLNRNWTFWKAAPIGDSDIKYTPEKKAEIKVVMKIYPDLTQPDGLWFGYFGDAASGTIVHAAAGSPSYGGGNVGNGTMGSIVVNDNFTKTETWTATAITAGPAAKFNVVGSVTGSRGLATSGSAYFSNSITPSNSEIQFTISDGGTAWAPGDTISVTTTQKTFV